MFKPKKPKQPENDLAGPDDLQTLTSEFRRSLKEWRDENNKPKIVTINGEEKPILCATTKKITEYAFAFTKIWLPNPVKQKEKYKNEWFIDCRGLYIKPDPFDIFYEDNILTNLAPVKFDDSIILEKRLFANKKFCGFAHFIDTEFRYKACFNGSEFNGETNFKGAQFLDEALFSGGKFKFKRAASFRGAKFNKNADFSNTHFSRIPIFYEANLPQSLSFDGIKFKKG